jgi:hypothetical protein
LLLELPQHFSLLGPPPLVRLLRPEQQLLLFMQVQQQQLVWLQMLQRLCMPVPQLLLALLISLPLLERRCLQLVRLQPFLPLVLLPPELLLLRVQRRLPCMQVRLLRLVLPPMQPLHLRHTSVVLERVVLPERVRGGPQVVSRVMSKSTGERNLKSSPH